MAPGPLDLHGGDSRVINPAGVDMGHSVLGRVHIVAKYDAPVIYSISLVDADDSFSMQSTSSFPSPGSLPLVSLSTRSIAPTATEVCLTGAA